MDSDESVYMETENLSKSLKINKADLKKIKVEA